MSNQQFTTESSGVVRESQSNIAIVIGGSGLVGRQLLTQLVESGYYQTIYAVVRKSFALPVSTESSLHKAQIQWLEIPDFSQMKSVIEKIDLTDADAFSALGSTLKKAGSKAAFYQIDHDYNLAFAQITYQRGAKHLLLVSAMGANATSLIYYNRVKGELETDVKQVGFQQVSIFRPSLLIGVRSQDSRLAEGLAQKVFTLSQSVLPATFSSRPIEAGRVAFAMRKVAQVHAQRSEQLTPAANVQIYSNQMMLRATLATSL